MRLSRSFLVVALAAVAVVAAFAVAGRPQPPSLEPVAATPAVPPAADRAMTAWHAPAPPVAPAPAARPVAVPEPAADWSALSVGIAPATAATAVAPAPDAAPADLEIAMTARERRALIAAAREPDGPVAPAGYRPGIAVIVPGGSHTDGVCR